MKYGISVPNFGEYGHPRTLAELARDADETGWGGFFMWDHIWLGLREPFVDPWVALAAVAMVTERIRIGTIVTPLPRRRPWKLARETVSLDRLSGGRLILSVGLGSPSDTEFEAFGDEGDLRTRAQMLDEGLEVLTGLWSGRPFSYQGTHYRLKEAVLLPPPVQSPRIPIWVAGGWPNKPPFRRAARWDGVVPNSARGGSLGPDDIRAIKTYVWQHRSLTDPFDIAAFTGLASREQPGHSGTIEAYGDAGATWLIYGVDPESDSLERTRAFVLKGPPSV
jgi:alkanesulfonate monooxygenase SsuD/methylene tetrahydromethanopterin reductase-like flavin-dependent oxidoreductase (luciferase family)